MGRFNLLDEPWISVLVERTGEKKDVSLLDFFQYASEYRSLAGEMETQNFAVMRFLLSIVQTVFSRFNYDGDVLPGIEINDRWQQTDPIDTDEDDEFCDAVSDCWNELYQSGNFPAIVCEYLEKWRDQFYLFDAKHPFFQVTQDEMTDIMSRIPKKNQPTSIYGKNLNRTISESENKTALFSPIANADKGKRGRKDILSEAELARWLLTFQGYSGLADKVSLTTADQRPSKGWLFDIGGIFLQGRSIFETLVMNYFPESPTDNEDLCGRIQKPCWEYSGGEVVNRLCMESPIDNLSELYTNWSRAIYIDPNANIAEPLSLLIVKIPEIDHSDNSIEPMTLWRKNDSGSKTSQYILKKHTADQSLWRSFGIIAMRTTEDGEYNKQPGIFKQYERLNHISSDNRWTDLVGISMKDDGNATSWLPTDEIYDSFQINDLVISDSDPNGWVLRINDAVETTKDVISKIFRGYLRGICEIRSLDLKNDSIAIGFIEKETTEMYAIIDPAFKEWLSKIQPTDSKETRIFEWKEQLKKLVLRRGESLFENSTVKDLVGIEKDSHVENIATKYWQFVNRIYKTLGKGGTLEH
ncbi:MAG: type I-E CRISPR-associated protein Cse1/CasA [Eubacteriales bacterium]|nr:type I-E CRISPR-associated protein Cse1/CasA [Eubacteriales bacterium]